MELNIITIALLIIIGAILILRKPKAVEPQDNGTMQLMMNQINELSRTVDTKLSESSKNLQDTLLTQSNSSFKMIRDITEELTSLKETNKQVMSFTEQLQSLQDILKNPKQRGVLGEYYLETLLKNVLSPGSYEMQYMFADGSIVDAIVRVKDKIIPIDSKFSLENYNKLVEEQNPAEKERLEKTFVNDLKMRITETSKYIKPSENTMDFAFMFIPHEAIYYDLLVNKIGALKDENENLIQRAASRYKVIIVSPTSFLAYLQTVLQGLNALRIEETAKDIVKRVEELGKHLKVYEESYNKIGTSLQTTFNHFNKSSAELKKIDKDIMRITESAPGIEALVLDKPEIEE
jgi:DNA recombination protein RmuC